MASWDDFKILMKDTIPTTYAGINDEGSYTNVAAKFADYIENNKDISPQELWANMLQYLQEETKAGYLRNSDGLPITEDLFGKSNVISLFEYINNKSDLPESFFNTLFNNYKVYLNNSKIDLTQTNGLVSGTDYFWNESVSKIISTLVRDFTYDGISKGVIINWSNNNYSVDLKDVLQPNAWKGGTGYVNPSKNTSGKTYVETRGEDLIKADATNSLNMGYTNDEARYSLRLGMPMYERQVKVEDLNRNFWVISQCIATISAYLFEEGSPFVSLFKDILSELVQLWENIMYLWAIFAIALYNKKIYTDVRCEVVSLSISDKYHLRKYDNFSNYDIYNNNGEVDKTKLEKILKDNLFYYKDEYPESNLVLMPFMRIDNYEYNYYREEWYPGLVFYDRNEDSWSVKLFQSFGVNSIFTENGIDYGCKFSMESYVPSTNGFSQTLYKDAVWAITQAKRGEAVGYFPYSEIINLEEWDNDTYYAAIRCLPSLSFTYEENNNEWTFVLQNCSINVNDAIGQAIKKWANQLTSSEISAMSSSQQALIPSIKNMGYLSCGFSITYDSASNSYKYFHGGTASSFYDTRKTQIKDISPFGYYLGELISGVSDSNKKYPNLITYNVYGRPIYNDIRNWEINKFYNGVSKQVPIWETDLVADNEMFNSLFALDRVDIDHWKDYQTEINIDDLDDFYFFTMTHQYGIHSDTINRIKKYYDYSNGIQDYYPANGDELSTGDPIIKFNNGNSISFVDATINTDSLAAQKGRRGNILSCGYFWNPFTKTLFYISNYFDYNRVNMNPTEIYYTIDDNGNKNPINYKFLDGTNVQVSDYKKQNTIKKVSNLKIDNIYQPLTANDITAGKISTAAVYTTTTHNRVDVKLTDSAFELNESNWAIRNVNTTITFGCVFNYQKRFNGKNWHFGFKPIDIGYEDEYNPVEYSDSINVVYQILTKNADIYYDLNEDDLYQAPFYILGYNSSMTDSDIITNFNAILGIINDGINNGQSETFIKNTLRNSGLINNISSNTMHVIPGYVTNINRLYLFPNHEYVIDILETNLFNGHSKQNYKKVFSSGTNFNVKEYINFQINPEKTTSQNFSDFIEAWNTYTKNYYNAQKITDKTVNSRGKLETFEKKTDSLNFSSAFQNGKIPIREGENENDQDSSGD